MMEMTSRLAIPRKKRTSRSIAGYLTAIIAVVLLTGCLTEPDQAHTDRCPPGATYDSETERCIGSQPRPDAGDAHDTGDDHNGGEVDAGDSNPDGGALPDADPQPDADTSISPCDGVSCGNNAQCIDGDCVCDDGYVGDPDDRCFTPPPCDGECAHGATCIDDQCRCDPGFATVADGCELLEVSDPASRTLAEVCQKWNEDPWTLTHDKWADEPQDQCDWGWLSEEYHLEAIRETTRYRWLVGLPAVTASDSARTITQACATTLAAENSGLTHTITEDFACYTSEAASGAGSSNIASHSASAADTVRRYIEDWNTPSLGHRRWIFNPRMAQTGYGIRSGYSCNYAFDISGPANPEFTAYPAPGYFPRQALHGKWSLAASSLTLSSDTTVTIENLTSGSTVSIHDFAHHAGSSFRPRMISWRLSQAPQSGESYRVIIGDAYGEGDDLVYEVDLIDC